MKNRLRDYEELIDLQDKAISALKQANQALELAMDVLIRARQEHGSLGNLFGQPAAWPPPSPYTMPGGSLPNTGLFTYTLPKQPWGGSTSGAQTGVVSSGSGVAIYNNASGGTAQQNMTVTSQNLAAKAEKDKLLQVLQDWQMATLGEY